VHSDLTFIDLFAGCGGLARGFRDAGFRAIGACEVDSDAAETYRLNIDAAIFQEPIESVVDDRWPRAHLVIGGPPCQGFSQLGRRDALDPRNALWTQYARVLAASGASLFVMENVPQLLRSDQYELFKETVERRGFAVQGRVLNSADYGVPETRRRAIVVGSRQGAFVFPEKTHGPDSAHGRPYADVRSALVGLPAVPSEEGWHRSRPGIRPESIIRYQAVPTSGGNRFQMQAELERRGLGHLVPPCWQKKTLGTTDVFGRMWWDRPAPTIRTEFYKPEKGRYLHPEEDRPITVREAARIQSFPDDFLFPEYQRMVSVARQIGNAVPPLLAKALATAVRAHLNSHKGHGIPSAVTARPIRQLALTP
jgi:DNA (cytosine-5)-methyltransferase 1